MNPFTARSPNSASFRGGVNESPRGPLIFQADIAKIGPRVGDDLPYPPFVVTVKSSLENVGQLGFVFHPL